MYYEMPVMNKLRSVLKKKGIENPTQLKAAIKKADPKGKGIAQGTALSAWNDPFWTPTASVLDLICLTFDIQPGDFLFFVKDEAAEVDRVVEMLEASGR